MLEEFSVQQGTMDFTKNPLDAAIDGDGYFVIQPKNGGAPSLSRRGIFQTSENGELLDGAGNKMLDGGLQPLVFQHLGRLQLLLKEKFL